MPMHNSYYKSDQAVDNNHSYNYAYRSIFRTTMQCNFIFGTSSRIHLQSRCSKNFVIWEVDTIPANNLNAAQNITYRTEQTGENEVSTLFIAATAINNNSKIICIASYIGGNEIARTQPAFLHIQGI